MDPTVHVKSLKQYIVQDLSRFPVICLYHIVDGMTGDAFLRTACVDAVQLRKKSIAGEEAADRIVQFFLPCPLYDVLSEIKAAPVSVSELIEAESFKDLIIVLYIVAAV